MSVRLCLIGFGEVGVTLADDLAGIAASTAAWDTKFDDPNSKPSTAARLRELHRGSSASDAVRDADIVVSAVTAAQTLNAAKAAASAMRRGALYLDLNSASPSAKIEAANVINVSGGHYVEGAVMSPIGPKRLASPILLGGRFADDAAPLLQQLGFSGATSFSKRYGRAAAAKLCRSVVVKGVEALLLEALATAEHYGVEDTVLASLSDLFPNQDWRKTSLYMTSRAIEHGARRAEEMREAARTVSEAGLDPFLSMATAQRQDWAAGFSAALPANDLQELLRAINNETPGGRS